MEKRMEGRREREATKDMKQCLTEGDMQMARKYLTRCSVPSTIRKMLIKTTLK